MNNNTHCSDCWVAFLGICYEEEIPNESNEEKKKEGEKYYFGGS